MLGMHAEPSRRPAARVVARNAKSETIQRSFGLSETEAMRNIRSRAPKTVAKCHATRFPPPVASASEPCCGFKLHRRRSSSCISHPGLSCVAFRLLLLREESLLAAAWKECTKREASIAAVCRIVVVVDTERVKKRGLCATRWIGCQCSSGADEADSRTQTHTRDF